MLIYAVDDERLALALVEHVVKTAVPDCELITFNDVYDYIEAVKKRKPHVALLDISMVELNGLQLAEKTAKLSPYTNIIFVTGFSEYSLEAFKLYASGYLLKPITVQKMKEQFEHLRYPVPVNDEVRAVTFGNFAVFLNDIPIHFHRQKSQELLAYLIEKCGSPVTRQELTLMLFEDETHSRASQKNLTNAVTTLSEDLEELGIGDLLIKSANSYAVNTKKLKCDLFDFKAGDTGLYQGLYMEQYSWGENFKALQMFDY